jgi:hypothetical protein
MSVEVYHGCPDCDYMIEEYQENTLIRYIILDNEEMKQLSELLKGLGF